MILKKVITFIFQNQNKLIKLQDKNTLQDLMHYHSKKCKNLKKTRCFNYNSQHESNMAIHQKRCQKAKYAL